MIPHPFGSSEEKDETPQSTAGDIHPTKAVIHRASSEPIRSNKETSPVLFCDYRLRQYGSLAEAFAKDFVPGNTDFTD